MTSSDIDLKKSRNNKKFYLAIAIQNHVKMWKINIILFNMKFVEFNKSIKINSKGQIKLKKND